MKEISLALKNASFIVCRKNGKEPEAPKDIDWNTLQINYDEANQKIKEDYNIGLVCGENDFVCIDCDSLELEQACEGLLPKTYIETTCSGGKHFIYRVKGKFENKNIDIGKNHLGEIKSHRVYIVIAPSIAKNKRDEIKSYIVEQEVNEIPYVTPEQIKKAVSQFVKIEERTPVTENAIQLLEKYGIHKTDKWIYEIIKNKVLIKKETGGNSIVLKNSAIILVREDLPEEEIRIIGKALAEFVEKRTLPMLFGWIKKAKNGELAQINEIEINNFIKNNNYPLTPYSKKGKKEKLFKNLHYQTTHLPYFHEFNCLIGLYGRHYLPVLKARYYQLFGGIIQRNFMIGKLFSDTRISVAYPLPTESGKNDLIYSIKDLIRSGIEKKNGSTFTLAEPTSFHPEALIGKFIDFEEVILNPETGKRKKIKKRIENRGHLNSDFLEFDECTNLITSIKPEHQQAREILSTAENPMGRNEIEKRLVEDTAENIVRYEPTCTNSYYFQPFKKIPEEAFLQGFLRRKLIPVGNVNAFLNFADDSMFQNKLNDLDFSRNDYKKRLIKFLEGVREFSNKELDIVFSDEAKELIRRYSLFLSGQAEIHSEKIANFSKISKYTTLSYLTKMSVIISFCYGKQIVDKNAVSLAYMDLVELFQNTLDFIYERTYGDFSYGTAWGGANYKQKECLQYLTQLKAFSKNNSGVSIADFVNVVMEVFEVKETQARQRYLEMKKNNLIDSSQIGQTDSVVWLKFNPFEQKELIDGNKGNEGYKGYTTYNMVFQQLNSIIEGLKPSQPHNPETMNLENIYK